MNLKVLEEIPLQPALDLVVVDNDEMVLHIVSKLIGNSANSYRGFVDTDVAMSHLGNTHPAPRVLVVDYYMPTMTGIEFISQLSSRLDLSQSCVLLCSAVAPRQKHMEQLDELGARVIDKSVIFERKALFELVEHNHNDTGN